jgi:DNA-binding FadR family transcriptional regulator
MCGNAALALFVDIVVRLADRYLPDGGTHRTAHQMLAAHDAIKQAVVSGDGGRAEILTADHVTAIRTSIQDEGKVAVDRSAVGSLRALLGQRSRQKLAEKIADTLIEDIINSRMPVGTLVGSEADLVEKMGVSPAVLREAVRMVEYHSVARMRLGPGGGLVVVEPDPAPIAETMAIYLDYMKVTASDVVYLRTALEQACVSVAVDRCSDTSVAERVRAAGLVHPSEERSRAGQFVSDLHTEIAALSGNPILELFVGILRHLWSRHLGIEFSIADLGAGAERTESEHRRIVEAILGGNGPLARILMREHLKWLPLSIVREQAAC